MRSTAIFPYKHKHKLNVDVRIEASPSYYCPLLQPTPSIAFYRMSVW